MIERRSNRRARNGRKTPKNVLFVFQNCTFRFADYIFSEIYSRYIELYRKTPAERYLALITMYPQILNIVSLRDIASYLLVTPVYLSRIRKNLVKNSHE